MRVSTLVETAFSGDVRISHIFAEIREVCEARTRDELREEMSDVLCFAQVWLFQRLRGRLDWSMPVGRYAANKFTARMAVWRDIFSREGLVFHPRYLVGGGNYAKPEKVRAALAAARSEAG
jgi:hypothetical protein